MSDPVLHKNDTNQKSSGDQIPLMNTELYKSTVAKTIRTTCPYCGVGCGVLASVASSGEISVKGDPAHPANFGKLCSKGSALAQTLGTKRRLTQPYYQNKPVAMQHRQCGVGTINNARCQRKLEPPCNIKHGPTHPHTHTECVHEMNERHI